MLEPALLHPQPFLPNPPYAIALTLSSITVDGELAPPLPELTRRLVFVGDSITAGFGAGLESAQVRYGARCGQPACERGAKADDGSRCCTSPLPPSPITLPAAVRPRQPHVPRGQRPHVREPPVRQFQRELLHDRVVRQGAVRQLADGGDRAGHARILRAGPCARRVTPDGCTRCEARYATSPHPRPLPLRSRPARARRRTPPSGTVRASRRTQS